MGSEKNWGIGDFGDLKAMLVDVAKRGGSFIGLNPIHALYPANPERASPYSPMNISRLVNVDDRTSSNACRGCQTGCSS